MNTSANLSTTLLQHVSCGEVVDGLVTELMESALEPFEELAVRAHLDGCAACREHLRQMRATVGLLGMLRGYSPPA